METPKEDRVENNATESASEQKRSHVGVARERTDSGPGSDSGLSGLDDSVTDESPRARTASRNSVHADSGCGRRTQSLELLAEDLASDLASDLVLTPSPKPGRRRLISTGAASSVSFSADEKKECQVHGTATPARSVPNIDEESPVSFSLRKSSSIPVHLTITAATKRELPPGLRPAPGDIVHSTRSLSEGRTVTPGSRPSSGMSTGSRMSAGSRQRITTTTTWGPDGRRISSTTSPSKVATAQKRVPVLPKGSSPHRSTPSLRDGHSGSRRDRTRRMQRDRVLNTSLEIWEIQRELKRGEMVQGVLSVGTAFGSRTSRGREDTCICAPVVIGRTDGHLEWRSM